MQWSFSSFVVLVFFSVSFRSGLITQWSHSSTCLGAQQSQVIPPWAPSISTCRSLCLVPACPFMPHETEHFVHDPQSDHLQFTVNHENTSINGLYSMSRDSSIHCVSIIFLLYLLGHGPLSQDSIFSFDPLQYSPSFSGNGLVQSLSCERFPVPQLTSQLDHSLHSDQPPWTEGN